MALWHIAAHGVTWSNGGMSVTPMLPRDLVVSNHRSGCNAKSQAKRPICEARASPEVGARRVLRPRHAGLRFQGDERRASILVLLLLSERPPAPLDPWRLSESQPQGRASDGTRCRDPSCRGP
jgi:hypothetical protein